MWKRLYLFLSIALTLVIGSNLTDAERSSVTKERMLSISSAIETYLEEEGHLPYATDIWELGGLLGKRLKGTPLKDAWGKPFYFSVSKNGSEGEDYWIASGTDQENFEGFLKYILKTGTNPGDLIVCNGKFIENPEEVIG